MLAGFDKDTRYAVRRAEREGVEVTRVTDAGDLKAIDALHGLVLETQRRAGFPKPPLQRYRTAWRGLAGAGRASIFEARREGQLLASGMLVVEGDRSFYLFAGSLREEKGEPKRYASYALQWAMMRHARDAGARTHDLWGVAPETATPEHPWYGVGLFKKGFGGRVVDLVRHLGHRGRPHPVPDAGHGRARPAGGAHAARSFPQERPMSEPRTMPFGQLADVIAPERVIGIPIGEVRDLAYDSRTVEPGTLFFAIPGVHVDGHDFVARAVERGALGVVVEREGPELHVPQLVVERSRDALADAADAWFGHPSRSLHVIGVTGTDGKTTTSFLAEAVLRAAGRRPGLIGHGRAGNRRRQDAEPGSQHDAGVA